MPNPTWSRKGVPSGGLMRSGPTNILATPLFVLPATSVSKIL